MKHKTNFVLEHGKDQWDLMINYRKGLRSPETMAAHAKYCRMIGDQKEYMRRCYADPNHDALPKISLTSAINRAKEYGCWIDESPEDVQKQLEIYRQVHRMNCEPGQKGKWSVDHIVELRNKGPHSSTNLQILTRSQNTVKSLNQRHAEKQ